MEMNFLKNMNSLVDWKGKRLLPSLNSSRIVNKLQLRSKEIRLGQGLGCTAMEKSESDAEMLNETFIQDWNKQDGINCCLGLSKQQSQGIRE